MIQDGEVMTVDGFKYRVRIGPPNQRECVRHPHLYTPCVAVKVIALDDSGAEEIAYEKAISDDDPEQIDETVHDLIHDLAGWWRRDGEEEKRQNELELAINRDACS